MNHEKQEKKLQKIHVQDPESEYELEYWRWPIGNLNQTFFYFIFGLYGKGDDNNLLWGMKNVYSLGTINDDDVGFSRLSNDPKIQIIQ